MSQTASPSSRRFSPLWLDGAFIVLILLFSYCVQEGLWLATAQGVYNPYKSDVEEYSGRLARLAYPDNFRRDTMFGHESWTTSFPNLQVSLGRLFPAGDNFNWALARQTAPLIFVFYLGFYIFGSWLFKSRLIGLLLALAMGMPDLPGFGTFWGICSQPPVPRSFFDALLPYYLMFAFWAVERPAWRPAVLFCASLMAWTHAISSLVMGGAWFIVYMFIKPPAWSWRGHFLNLCLGALAFLLPLLCFTLPSLMAKTAPSDDPAFAEMFRKNFMERFKDPFEDLGRFLWRYSFDRPLIPLAAAGFGTTMALGSKTSRRICLLCVFWLFGIVFCAVFINWLEQLAAARLHKLSILHQLIRGLRFCIPVFYLMAACGLKCVFERLREKWRVALTAALFLFLTIGIYPYLGRLAYYGAYWAGEEIGARFWFSDMFDEQTREQTSRREAMLAIRDIVPPDGLVFSSNGDAAVRYYGLRSLDFCQTDGAHLYFQYNAPACRRWLDNMEALKSPQGYIEAFAKSSAEWLITDRPGDEELLRGLGPVVWRNSRYLILRKGEKP